MSAIDALLDWNPTSERVHQIVLACLLQRTPLAEKLRFGTGAPTGIQEETYGRLYDLTVSFVKRTEVHLELKVDSALYERQVERQMKFLPDEDLLVYVLLGTARFEWDEKRFEKVRQKTGKPPRERLRRIELSQLRDSVDRLAPATSSADHRDLATAYGALLRRIAALTEQFEAKPLQEWDGHDWQGFYASVRQRLNLGDAGQRYVPNRRGGFFGMWWHGLDLPLSTGAEAYLQAEQEKLCFKVSASTEGAPDRAAVRDRFREELLAAAQELHFPMRTPKRALGNCMTVAVSGESYMGSGERVDWASCQETIKRAMRVLEAAVRRCEHGGGPPASPA